MRPLDFYVKRVRAVPARPVLVSASIEADDFSAMWWLMVSDAVHKALVDAIGIPPADRFHVVTAHDREDLIFDPGYLDVARTPGFIAVHITLRRGRAAEKKRALYRAIADNVNAATGTRVEDVMVVLSENDAIDWSFGGGVAQYAPAD